MDYCVIDSAEFTYPDIKTYKNVSRSADVFCAVGGYASFQIFLTECDKEDINVSVNCPGFEIYDLYPIYVESNLKLGEDPNGLCPARVAPYYVNDALMPYRGKLKISEYNTAGLYICMKATKPGEIDCSVTVGELNVPVHIKVYDVIIPETFCHLQNYDCNFDIYHGIPKNTPEFENMHLQYLRLFRRLRVNVMNVPETSYSVSKNEKHEYVFDYSGTEKEIRKGLELGFRKFMLLTVAHKEKWGSPNLIINGLEINAMDFDAYKYLIAKLGSLYEMIHRNGWEDICLVSVSDEPGGANETAYVALCAKVRKLMPGVKIAEAVGSPYIGGGPDIWIPLSNGYEIGRPCFDAIRKDGSEFWFYTCNCPRTNRTLNRYTDYALMCTHLLFWGGYSYDLTGYLHWAMNVYQKEKNDDGTRRPQNPFACSCPWHVNADHEVMLPPGDANLIYPGGYMGNGTVQEPWNSMRAENQRESAEEYELLRLLAKKDKKAADGLCSKLFRSFEDFDADVKKLRSVTREIMERLSEK